MPKETVGVRLDSDEIAKIDELKGNKSRSEYIRAMLDQDSSQDNTREREEEVQRRLEREESNREKQRKLEEEARARGEELAKRELFMPPAPDDIEEKKSFAQRVNNFASTYSKAQLGEMLATSYENLKKTKGDYKRLYNILYALHDRFPEIDVNALVQAVASNPAQYAQQPVQPPQKEKETENSGWMKEIMPLLMVQMISRPAPAQQPLITPEVLAMLKPSERNVKITDKNGNVTEMPIELYLQSQRQPGLTAADIAKIMEKYMPKGDDRGSLAEQIKVLKEYKEVFQGETPETAKVKEEETTKRQQISTDKEIELAKLNAKERQAKVTEKLINMAMGISPDTPEQQQQQCGPHQTMEEKIGGEFLKTAIGDVDRSPEKVEKARELTGESIAK